MYQIQNLQKNLKQKKHKKEEDMEFEEDLDDLEFPEDINLEEEDMESGDIL